MSSKKTEYIHHSSYISFDQEFIAWIPLAENWRSYDTHELVGDLANLGDALDGKSERDGAEVLVHVGHRIKIAHLDQLLCQQLAEAPVPRVVRVEKVRNMSLKHNLQLATELVVVFEF